MMCCSTFHAFPQAKKEKKAKKLKKAACYHDSARFKVVRPACRPRRESEARAATAITVRLDYLRGGGSSLHALAQVTAETAVTAPVVAATAPG